MASSNVCLRRSSHSVSNSFSSDRASDHDANKLALNLSLNQPDGSDSLHSELVPPTQTPPELLSELMRTALLPSERFQVLSVPNDAQNQQNRNEHQGRASLSENSRGVLGIKSKSNSKSSRHSQPQQHHSKEPLSVVCFSPLLGYSDVACVQLLLANISNRPLQYQIRIRNSSSITASPNGCGSLKPHSSSKVLLIWRYQQTAASSAQKPAETHGDRKHLAGSTALAETTFLMQTQFTDALPDPELTVQKIVAHVMPHTHCTVANPPVESFFFDTSDVHSGVSTAEWITQSPRSALQHSSGVTQTSSVPRQLKSAWLLKLSVVVLVCALIIYWDRFVKYDGEQLETETNL